MIPSISSIPPIKAVDNTSTVNEIILQRYYQVEQKLLLFHLSLKWQHVLNQRVWDNLKILDLRFCQVNDQNIPLIVKYRWPNLQDLKLENQKNCLRNITQKGLIKLINYEWKQLIKLNLKNNNIQNIGFQQLVQKLGWKLVSLQVDKNNISYQGLQILKELKFDKLKILSLNNNNIGLKGVQMLVKADLMLQRIQLGGCGLCSGSLVTIIKKSKWITLRSIQLDDNKIGYDVYSSIYENNWKQLIQFNNLQQKEGTQIFLMQLILSSWQRQNVKFSVLRFKYKQKKYQDIKSIIEARFNNCRFNI